MICQACGKCIMPNDMFIVKFEGKLLPINATWIACNPCATALASDLVYCFPPDILKSVNIYAYRNRRGKK